MLKSQIQGNLVLDLTKYETNYASVFFALLDPSTSSRGDKLIELCSHFHTHFQQFAQGVIYAVYP
jgi:hypothetical protein